MGSGLDYAAGILGAVLIIVLITVAAMNSCSRDYKREAIERGYAHHNSETGLWEWKEKGKVEPCSKNSAKP